MARDTDRTTTDEQPPEEQTFPRERLIAEAEDFTGHPPHVVAGALAHLDARKQHFTLDESVKAIKDWLKKPVDG